jgi:transcriptional regulator with XRE-family HTH domain
MASEVAASIGREVLIARTTEGLSLRAAARLAGVAPATQRKVERGDAAVELASVCRVASASGLKVWARVFPATPPSLRDSGQLWIAEHLRSQAHLSYSITTELPMRNHRSADQVWFGPTEVIHVEIERLLADWQSQVRRAIDKREELAAMHQRPVRLVLAIEDTRRNRAAARAHASVVASMLPAGSREVLATMRTGRPLGRDGIVWVRRPAP